MTQLYGVIGDPVAQSLSPLIHNFWTRQNNLDASYHAMQVPAGDLASALKTLERRGAKGLNITMPHKHDALDLADVASPVAKRIGAANTLVRTQAGGWRAENTDAPGFKETLLAAELDVVGRNILVIGAGGASRAVIDVLHDMGARLIICNRTLKKAVMLAESYGDKHRALSLDELNYGIRQCTIIVNTASLGFSGEILKLPKARGRVFMDISYGRAAAAMLAEADSKGWRTLDGLPMLVSQAAFSFEHWFGVLPDVGSALDRCRAAVEAVS